MWTVCCISNSLLQILEPKKSDPISKLDLHVEYIDKDKLRLVDIDFTSN